MTHDRTTQDRMTHGRMTHDRMTHDRMTHGRMTHDMMTQDRMTNDRMTHGRITHDRITHGWMTHDRMTSVNSAHSVIASKVHSPRFPHSPLVVGEIGQKIGQYFSHIFINLHVQITTLGQYHSQCSTSIY